MKINILINHLLFSLLLCNRLLATNAQVGYTHIECTIVPMAIKEKTENKERNVSHPHIPGPKVYDKVGPQHQATSTNWSGYVAADNLNNPTQNSVSAVYGSWIVPTIAQATNHPYSAIWIGIDGYRSPTVEQIGTGHDFYNRTQQHYAWFEMYPSGSYYINGFPVNPGDVISASVEYSGNNIFTMRIYNDTKKVGTTIPTTYTTSSTAKRNSAEWIVEAPYLNGVLPLSNFKTAYFWGCIAKINGILNVLNNNSWHNESIKMITTTNIPKAIPSEVLQDSGSFFVTWNHH